jgi:hypothetical protein
MWPEVESGLEAWLGWCLDVGLGRTLVWAEPEICAGLDLGWSSLGLRRACVGLLGLCLVCVGFVGLGMAWNWPGLGPVWD